MRPSSSPQQSSQSDMFNRRLDETHELVKRAHLVDGNVFDCPYDSQYHSDHGASALPTRRMVSLLFLKVLEQTTRIKWK
ncbi:MAG: hypothetical protein LBJ67_01955 [Planctomycetaceae bacterium]|nr:hypothetical protein [Planctomycetaceae bacterium]